jgi:hypothetical protein
MHCLVKGTLSRQPWFVICVRRGAGGIARAAMLVHPKAASLLRLGGEKIRRCETRQRKLEYRHAHYDFRGTRNMSSTTCLDRDDGPRCKQCHHYAGGLVQGKKRVGMVISSHSLGPKFHFTDKKTSPPPPQVLEERRNIFHNLDIQGAARTSPNRGTPRRVRHRLHMSPSVYAVPGSDEFKKKENKISDIPSKEDAAHSCARYTNVSMVIGAEGNVTHTPLRPPSPPPAHMYDTAPQRPHVGTPTLPTKQAACLQADCHVVNCRRYFIGTPAPLPINLNIPPATNLTTPHMTVNMQMNPSLVAGDTLNLNIKDELCKAREEVECLKRQNQHLLENNERLNEVNRDLPKTSGLMYDFCVGKHEAEISVIRSQMKFNASNLDTALKKAESNKNNIRQKLDSVSRDLNAERRNHNTLKRTTQSRWTSQPAVKDLAH